MRPFGFCFLIAASTLILPVACDTGGETATPPCIGATGGGGQTASGNPASSTTSGVGGGLVAGCQPPCAAGSICSAASTCIPEGTCVDAEDCAAGLTCDATTKTCVPGGNCGSQEASAALLSPNLLMVLDRSCSMMSKVNGVTKWQIALAAIGTMMTAYQNKIRFGLTLFPDLVAPDCGQAVIPFPPTVGNELPIANFLFNALSFVNPFYPKGPCVTNIDTAMLQASTEPALTDPTRENFVMLITDGAQWKGCSLGGADAGTEATITALLAAGVKTFVIGFGGSDIDPQALNAFADAGGVGVNNGMIHYYNAADAVSLDQALAAIATQAMSCTYVLDKPIDDPDQLFAFFNNDPVKVPRDETHLNGWDYDAATNSVTFYGPYCDQLKAGKVTDVDLVNGCSEPTPG